MTIKKFTLCLDEDLLKKTKLRAVEEGRPVNQIIAELLENYLKETNKTSKEK